MPIINPFLIEISLANLIFEVLIQKDFCTNEVSEASLNEYKRINICSNFWQIAYYGRTPQTHNKFYSPYVTLNYRALISIL